MIQIVTDFLSLSLMLLGLFLTSINLPGALLVFAGILLSSWVDGFTHLSPTLVTIMGILAIASLFLDNLVMLLGGKKFGASKWGLIGAFAGGFIFLFILGPLGIIIGPFVGAVCFELAFDKKSLHRATKAGMGALIGTLIGIGLKFAISAGLMTTWLIKQFSVYF